MRTPFLPLAAALSLAAAPPAPYSPDLSKWRLEITPALGGWITAPAVNLRIKLVDPRDPDPPREEDQDFAPEMDEGEPEEDAADLTPAAALAQRKARERAQAEEQLRNGWRQRQLRIWFNGSERVVQARVGYSFSDTFDCQDGENRLEVQEPDSGLRVVRTWWASAARMRLQIAQVEASEGNWSGNLEVMEPNGDVGGSWRKTPSGGVGGWNRYTHANPPAGTYTLRWTAIPRYANPCTVMVEVLLDGGTERERRWRFSRLLLPGTGSVTLGTLDVED